MAHSEQELNQTRAWINAARPRTLPLALASVAMGSFLAAADRSLSWPIVLLCALTAVFLQILSNLANDYGDAVHGADHEQRQGPVRAVQTGLISEKEMKGAVSLVTLLSVIFGITLLWLAFGSDRSVLLLLFLLFGAAAIGAAIGYTAGIRPYGYAGWGDAAVLVFFGWIGVSGTYFLQTHHFDWAVLLPATSCGLLAVAVLNVNNIRDLESDRAAGKRSIPVRLGPRWARRYHWGLLAGVVLTAVLYVLFNLTGYWQFLFLLSLPLLWQNGRVVSRSHQPRQLAPMLKQTVLTTLMFVLTFGLGQLL